MNPKVAFVGLAVIGVLFAGGVGVGVGIPDPKGFSLKNPPGWLKSMASLLTNESSTKIPSSAMREDLEGGKSEPFKSPVDLGKTSQKSYAFQRGYTIAESRQGVRKLKLRNEGANKVTVLWRPAGSGNPDQSFTLLPNALQTVTVLGEGGRLTLKIEDSESARVVVE
jgi:hypothetical protein